MDQTTLVSPAVEEGRKFLRVLDNAGIKVRAALWEKDDSLGATWRLDIVTPIADEIGHRETFRKIYEALDEQPGQTKVATLDVYLHGTKSDFYKNLRRSFGKSKDLIISNISIGFRSMSDAYIYFVK